LCSHEAEKLNSRNEQIALLHCCLHVRAFSRLRPIQFLKCRSYSRLRLQGLTLKRRLKT